MLGTGTPNAEPERSGPAVAVVVGEHAYLVDFGPGVVRRAAAAHQAGISALAVTNLARAFLTHLHSDHSAGYPDLIFTPGVLGRSQPLEVYGPPGLKSMTEHILQAYQADLRERLEGLEPADPAGYQVNAHEVEPGIVYKDDLLQVEAFPVRHGSWPAYAYKFTAPDRTIVISGDTAPVEIIAEKARGCDVLVHEVYSVEGFKKRPPEWQKYHASVHTSSHELARLAQAGQPKLLVLYHQLFWGVTAQALVEEVRSLYDGEVISANDLDVF
jgi:ribonuclease BN (tRNA processing enzyme)